MTLTTENEKGDAVTTEKYRYKYEYSRRFGQPFHVWSAVGARGGAHLHITDYGEEHEAKGGARHSGGIEFHSRVPMPGVDRPPDCDDCWLLHAPCWHDGSSLAASERWIPMWRDEPNDHDGICRALGSEAERYLEATKENER